MKQLIITTAIIFLTMSLSAQKQKVIFDCDLGGDIDDAFAVALLLSSQNDFEILGLCMDHGNTPGRGQIATKMLYETGLDNIPVYLGRHTPTVVGEDTELEGRSTQMIWAEGFDKLQPQKKPAVDFVIETLNKYPGEVILFTVGPVDNIGDVIDKDPEALKKAKKVISMFGSVLSGYGGGKPSAEWNVRGSIAAAKKFIGSGANIILAPLGVTDHVIYPENYLMAVSMRQTPLTDAISALYSLWFRHADWATRPKMFDGVAVGMALWPELFEFEEMHIIVDDEGYTKEIDGKAPNCKVGVKIEKDEFIKRMHHRIITQNFKRK